MVALSSGAIAAEPDPVTRGEYLVNAADCVGCHTDVDHHGKPYAGGRPLATPFGTFYSPNITPELETGIGRWSEAQFLHALRDGVRADGANLFPVFPYPSYTGITDTDAVAIKAYLFAQPTVRQPNRAHDVPFPLSWRWLQTPWKWLFFTPGPFRPAPDRDAVWNRGAYLVTAVAHCGECHTPRNWFGAMEMSRFLAGNPHGPDGKPVPNITPDPNSGIGNWSEEDIIGVLTDGHTPEFDFVGGAMAEVVKSTSRLTDADRRAIAVYLRAVPAKPSATKR
ncbi:MAG: cytochrome c [Alphaproteobacteria bacterium]|nr:cytochrome c [Alphaproteobacteria bacterium]MBV9967038.1 cytochrome c [Alphaproteobacteria bacterium]